MANRWLGPLVLCVAVLPLAAAAGASLVLRIDVSVLTRDPTSIAGIHPLSGVLSSLGILLWWTSASIWLFSAGVLREASASLHADFALWSGALSAVIGFDDLFLFHDGIAPYRLGVPEQAVYVALGLVVALYVVMYRSIIMRGANPLLLVALALLSSSVAVDVVLETRLARWVRGRISLKTG